MKGFIFGILTMILILVLGLSFALMGFVSMRADSPPSKLTVAKTSGRLFRAQLVAGRELPCLRRLLRNRSS